MVSKSIIIKDVYKSISESDLPEMSIEDIAELLTKNPKGISDYVKYELVSHPVNFRNVLEDTRKDITFHYTEKIQKPIHGELEVFEGFKFRNISEHQTSERVTKVDYVSFFTKIKEGLSEHRVYQIGRRYLNKEIENLEDLKRKYMKEQDNTALIETLKKIIQLSPDNLRNLQNLLEIHRTNGEYDKVMEIGKQMLLLNGRSYDAWNFIGEVFYHKGDIDKATKLFERAIQLYPKYFKALYNLAKVSFESKNFELALSYCSTHLEADITDAKIYSKDIQLLLESILKDLKDIISANPEDIENRTILGEFYYDNSNFNKALVIFNEIIANEPDNLDALVFKGLINVENENYNEAIQIYKKVIVLDPDDEVVWDNLGIAYEYNGELQKAIDAYKKALELSPHDLEIRQRLAMIHLSSPKTDLQVDNTGKLLKEDQITFYRTQVLEYYNKDFINPMVQANKENEAFKKFINLEFPKLISNSEVYYTLESLKSLILKSIENTDKLIYLILPIIHPEILSYCSEYAFQRKEVMFILVSYWDLSLYGKILSSMTALGNIQIRQLTMPTNSLIIRRDDSELLLALIEKNPEDIICIKSEDTGLVKFLGDMVHIYMGMSRPIQ